MKRKRTTGKKKTGGGKKDPRGDVNTRISSAWKTIEKHLTKIKSPILETLNPPATETEFEEFEKTFGRPIPPELRACYAIHNGQTNGYTSETAFFGVMDDLVRFLPISDWETHLDGGYLECYAEGIPNPEQEKLEEEFKKKLEEDEKKGIKSRGKGGKGLREKVTDNPLSAFISFSGSEREESSTGFFLGISKTEGKDAQVRNWACDGVPDITCTKIHGTFVNWFEKFAFKMTKELKPEEEGNEDEDEEEEEEDGKKKKKKKKVEKKKSVSSSNKLQDMNCIITGIFDTLSAEEVAQFVIRHGGKVSANVTGLVTHMILGAPGVLPPYNTPTGKGSKKYREAKKKKRIKIIEGEKALMELVGE